MLRLIPLLASLALGDSVPAAPPLAPVSVEQDGVSFVVHRQPAIPVVALRLALLADDPPGYAGAGHLFQHLAYPSLREQVARVGGNLEMERTPDALVYTVSGPAAELEYLAGVLRGALRPRQPTEAELLRAHRDLAEERLSEWEVAAPHTRAALRARLFPADLSAAGTESSALRLTREVLPEVWAELYRPERITVIAVGDVSLEGVRRAFGALPPPPARSLSGELRDTVQLRPMAPAEATRGWAAAGYLTGDLSPAAVSVAARLLRDRLRQRLPRAAIEGEHWWSHHGQALVLIAAVPGAELTTTERALESAAAGLAADLSPRQVREAAQAVRRDILFFARTPPRMATVLGRFVDRQGDADAAQRFYAQLAAVEEAQVREVLAHLATQTPVRVQLPPQKLRTRP